MSLGRYIKDLRKERSWTQRDLADLLGVRQPTLSRWESDQAMPDFDLVERLSTLCNIHKTAILQFYQGQTAPGADGNGGFAEDAGQPLAPPSERTAAQRLKEARFAAGYATAKIAAEANGWSYATYLSHESGRRRLRLRAATLYAAAFKCPVETLFMDKAAKLNEHSVVTRSPSLFGMSDADLRLETLLSTLDPEVKRRLLDIAHILAFWPKPEQD